MASFRLVNVHTGQLTCHELSTGPPYIAISHAWSEGLFLPGADFLSSPGHSMLYAGIQQRFKGITHCWADTISIDQSSDDDKHRQIPLMGRIFGDAVAVFILQRISLGLDQADIDQCSALLQPALELHENESWQEHGEYWQSGSGRKLIVMGMQGISRLTRTPWTTRVWTLQEYILATQVIWIGTDLKPVTVPDLLFAALPDICDTLVIDECLGKEFQKIYSFFSGMANCRFGRGDKTRVMELLGNRNASVPCDEVYGVMAASGVEIPSRGGMSKEEAWQLWCEEAVRQGHIRWLLMPAVMDASTAAGAHNCAFPDFVGRHKASSSSGLDSVSPLGSTSVERGTCEVSGRWIGSCKLIAKLGTVHEPSPNRIHRDITLILFAKGRWRLAYLVALAFGAGRYNLRQTRFIARTLMVNYWRCRQSICNQQQETFKVRLSDQTQKYVWSDFMELQMSQMPAMNNGIAYLAHTTGCLHHCIHAVVVSGDDVPGARLEAIDIGGRTNSGRCIFMIVERPSTKLDVVESSSYRCLEFGQTGSGSSTWTDFTLHKVAVTLPISDDYEAVISQLPLTRFKVGGQSCRYCSNNAPRAPPSTPSAAQPLPTRTQKENAGNIRRYISYESQVFRLMLRKSHLQRLLKQMRHAEPRQRKMLQAMRRRSQTLSAKLHRMLATCRKLPSA